jgi:outer membrane protein assembly factor BamB
MATCRRSLLTLSLLAFLVPTAMAEDWPGWRGPHGDGTTTDSGPLTWGPNKNIAWRTPIPGIGRSSPIVSGGRVYVTSGVEEDLSRRMIALDAGNGRVLWNAVVHTGPAGQAHRQNTTASSTPVTDGKRVYAVFVDDTAMTVVAVDTNGEVAWRVEPGTYYSQHGFAASPVLTDYGLVINGQQDGDNSFVVTLDPETGKEVWRYRPATNLRSFSTPVLIEHNGQEQLILSGSSETVGLDPATGKLIWSTDGPSQKFVCTPSVGHGLVFSFGGSPSKSGYAIPLGKTGKLKYSDLAWKLDRSMPYVPSPVLFGDYLHIANDQGIYTCIEPATGKVLLTERRFGKVYSSPVAAGDRIYIFEDSGACTVIANGPDFQELARNELGDVLIQTTPAIVDGSLFIRTEQDVIAIREQ